MNVFLSDPIIIAVSSCLNDHDVRYDGCHKRNSIITNQYSQYFNLLSICPEVAIGLGVPREPIKIVQDKLNCEKFYLVNESNSNINHTELMLSYTNQQYDKLNSICGYVVKERSPSCGYKQTPRYTIAGDIISTGPGFFTEQIMLNVPWIPIISESGLEDPKQHDNFLERVFILHLWNVIYKKNKQLTEFHDKIKHQIELRGRELNLAQKFQDETSSEAENKYITEIMTILKMSVTREKQINFLNMISQEHKIARKQLTGVIQNFQNKEVTMWNVIQQFQKVFDEEKIFVNSNYFFPDVLEIKSREFYFEQQ